MSVRVTGHDYSSYLAHHQVPGLVNHAKAFISAYKNADRKTFSSTSSEASTGENLCQVRMSLESTPHTQLALFLDSPKGDWVLGERNVPKPEADEVLVRLLATGLNPSEWKTREYAPSYITEYPAVLGVDGAGEVVEVGKDVQYLARGDKM